MWSFERDEYVQEQNSGMCSIVGRGDTDGQAGQAFVKLIAI